MAKITMEIRDGDRKIERVIPSLAFIMGLFLIITGIVLKEYLLWGIGCGIIILGGLYLVFEDTRSGYREMRAYGELAKGLLEYWGLGLASVIAAVCAIPPHPALPLWTLGASVPVGLLFITQGLRNTYGKSKG